MDYDLRIDRVVLLYSIFLAFSTGVVFGAWPAIRASRRNFLADLNASGLAFSQAPGRTPILKFLLISQIAVAQFLAAGAFTFLASFAAARNVTLGFDANKGVLTFMLIPTGDSPRVNWAEVAEHVAAIPGVRRATYAGKVPLEESGMGTVKAGLPGASESESQAVGFDIVGPGYFGVLGTRILAGRDFDRWWLPGSSRVAAADEAAARLFWPNITLNDVVGRWIRTEVWTFKSRGSSRIRSMEVYTRCRTHACSGLSHKARAK